MPFMEKVVNRGDIANVHFMFNFIISIMLLPFTNQVAKLTGKIIKDDEESKIDKELASLDPRLIATPAIAISQARNVMFAMADCIRENFSIACGLISEYNEEDAAKLEENEDFIDRCESSLNNFLLKVTSQNNMSRSERLDVSELLNSLSDMERIGDHCENLLVVSRNIIDQKINFSDQGMKEIQTALKATDNIIDMTLSAFKEDDLQAISRIEPLAQTISEITELIKDHHVVRLQVGECGIPGGFALVDILTSLDRIGSHCKNIGLHIAKKIRGIHMDEMHGHIYITGYKTSEEYKALYAYYSSMYADPITDGFNSSLKELRQITTADEETDTSDTEKSENAPGTDAMASEKPVKDKENGRQKESQKKSNDGQSGKKKSTKNKVSEKHDKIKERINDKYSEKNKKSQKKK